MQHSDLKYRGVGISETPITRYDIMSFKPHQNEVGYRSNDFVTTTKAN